MINASSFSAIPRLIKYKLSVAVTLSAVAGWFLSGEGFEPQLIGLILGVFFLAGASSALNQYQERHWDTRMDRTRNRPLPTGKITPATAWVIAIILTLSGAILLARFGWIPVGLGLGTLALYNLLYTPLKRVTSFALIPGGLVGAIPPMIGWSASGRSVWDPAILFVTALIFLWQLPHFWLLIMRYAKEYEAAGFKTIRSYLNENQVKRLVFIWICSSSVLILLYPVFEIQLPIWLAALMILLNAAMVLTFYKLLFKQIRRSYEQLLFILTNLFLLLLLLILILGSVL